ncbi:MAG: sigma-70 family RNA polymerase sigma factor [Rhizobacter sp.]|nr:sigma-70 family RNA polymerase sigma factor [Rhizobacter sp.]
MAGSTAESASGDAELLGVLDDGRRRFLELVAEIRPELLRYCARMTGSIADGEDVVQDTLARACYELSQMTELPALRPWLFTIAHHRAIDRWRRESHRAAESLDAAADVPGDAALEPEHAAARRQAVQAALSTFLALAPAQRACVILKDVLDHSLDEIAAELALSVAAVKAALHRGRVALRAAASSAPAAAGARDVSPELVEYVRLFGRHDWDGVRALLADDVRLDLVAQRKAAGRRAVGSYFSNYARTAGWRVAPGLFDGREAMAVWTEASIEPAYVVALEWRDGRVVAIRDFRYARYVMLDGRFEAGAKDTP